MTVFCALVFAAGVLIGVLIGLLYVRLCGSRKIRLPVAPDDQDAASLGVPIGGLYRNGSVIQVRRQ